MTLLERDILAVLISLDVIFMILILPNVIPINFDFNSPLLYGLTLAFGLPLGALGVWMNHRSAALERDKPARPPQRK